MVDGRMGRWWVDGWIDGGWILEGQMDERTMHTCRNGI